jgi:hypothetical protein
MFSIIPGRQFREETKAEFVAGSLNCSPEGNRSLSRITIIGNQVAVPFRGDKVSR